MTKYSACAPAKINLHLHVTGKRPDGYHLLESLIVFGIFGDQLSISLASNTRVKIEDISGPFARSVPQDEDNLIIQTALLLKQHFNIKKGASIRIEKKLPVGAGIGGGSSNAATAAKLLCKLWNIECSLEELCTLLLPLGADIPVCLHSKASFVQGIGEKILPTTLPAPLYAVLINPHISVSTAKIFRAGFKGFSTPTKEIPSFLSSETLCQWLEQQTNDLTYTACSIVPEIQKILDIFDYDRDCYFSAMSGSGATCFGLYPSLDIAQQAQEKIAHACSEWWCVATTLS